MWPGKCTGLSSSEFQIRRVRVSSLKLLISVRPTSSAVLHKDHKAMAESVHFCQPRRSQSPFPLDVIAKMQVSTLDLSSIHTCIGWGRLLLAEANYFPSIILLITVLVLTLSRRKVRKPRLDAYFVYTSSRVHILVFGYVAGE